MEKMDNLTVFFPAYNEEENIVNVVERALSILPDYARNFEILIINDGSRDNTLMLSRELAKKHAAVKVFSHETNQGYGAALKTGFRNSLYPNIFYSDGDGQFDLNEIGLLLPFLPGNDIVAGYRIKRMDPVHRIINGKAYNMLIRLLFNLNVRDIDCAFKLIKRTVTDSLHLKSNAAFISAELLIRAKSKGFRIKQIGVHHFPRGKGLPSGNNPMVVLRSFRELFTLRKELK